LAYIFPPPQAGERYTAINYPFVYRIFSWCAKGIVIFIIIDRHYGFEFVAKKAWTKKIRPRFFAAPLAKLRG